MTNARFEDLEQRVKKIKLKKFLKVCVVFFIFLGLGYYISFYNKPIEIKKPLHVKKEKVIKEVSKVQKFEPIKQVKKKVIILKKEPLYNTLKLSPTVNLHTTVVKEETNILVKVEPKKKKKITLHVKEVKSEDALLERFRTAGDFESAMGLAYLYFEKKKFEKSVYWSKKASKLSSGDESAWIVYAKSKHALGKTQDAIKALQLYLEYFSSTDIDRLLKLYRDKK